MKNLQNIAQSFLGTGLGKSILELFQGKGKGLFGGDNAIILVILLLVVIVHALTESISRRAERERTMVECWRGKSRLLAAVFALAFGFFGVHRFYIRSIGPGILQLLGTVAFVLGAWMLGNARFADFIMLSDAASMGLMLFVSGLAMQLWHISDFFMILFGGLIPKRRRKKEGKTERTAA